MTPELQAKLEVFREKAREGILTREEMQEAIQLLADGRMSAAKASPRARVKTAKEAIPDADDLLKDLF
jgi:hypothetical protein